MSKATVRTKEDYNLLKAVLTYARGQLLEELSVAEKEVKQVGFNVYWNNKFTELTTSLKQLNGITVELSDETTNPVHEGVYSVDDQKA
jgi:hypothetical protein